MNRYVLVDVSFVCNRAFHGFGNAQLKQGCQDTEVLYGFMKTMFRIESELQPDTIIFCFDGGYAYRLSVFPDYKQKRQESRELESDVEKEARQGMYTQIRTLQHEILPAVGSKNVWWIKGFEGDDLIAYAAKKLTHASKVYIVSSDEDLWQCLDGERVVQYDLKNRGRFKEASLFERYGVTPAQWPSVKAYAGCTSDSILGITGIGPKYAANYVAGKKLPEKKLSLFVGTEELYTRNVAITTLPAPGLPELEIVEDSHLDWDVMARAIGAKDRSQPLLGVR